MGKSGDERVTDALTKLREAIRVYFAELSQWKIAPGGREKPAPPEAWSLYKEHQYWNKRLPWEGTLWDQPYILMLEFAVCNEEERRQAEDEATRLRAEEEFRKLRERMG